MNPDFYGAKRRRWKNKYDITLVRFKGSRTEKSRSKYINEDRQIIKI